MTPTKTELMERVSELSETLVEIRSLIDEIIQVDDVDNGSEEE